MKLREKINSGFVILDGATGTNLQKKGLGLGDCPEEWIVKNKEAFIELQEEYLKAGSDCLYTPTFTANRIKLNEYGLEDDMENLISQLVSCSREAIKRAAVDRDVFLLGDISMTGVQVEPLGELAFEDLVDIYKEQVKYLVDCGVDGFAIETMMSLSESRAALLAVKESCDLPVIVSLTYEEDKRTLYGTTPETALVVLQAMGADAVGINCSSGPDKMLSMIQSMKKYAKIPLIVKPNAGLPVLKDGETVFSMGPDEFADKMIDLCKVGATLVGGCCGTTPEHIGKLKQRIDMEIASGNLNEKLEISPSSDMRLLTTERNITSISLDSNFIIVGERINPTGKKTLQEELKTGSLDMVIDMAEEQVELGAKVLDVNMGMNGIDEKEMMLKAIKELSMHVDVPLSIDSSYVDVVESALRIYPGRALINSISLEKEKFEKLIPIAKKYGAMFILLPLSDEGLPKSKDEKHGIINKIYNRALSVGLSKEDIVVDGLVTTVGANKNAAKEVLETIDYCKNELELATICGLSNISFGLPERVFVNSAFLTLAIGRGLTMAIANPSQTLLTNASLATDLLLNKEEADVKYIDGVNSISISNDVKNETKNIEGHPLFVAVVKGKKNQIIQLVKKALDDGETPDDIINNHLIAGINKVGEFFEEKTYYLPQLISSAETMKLAIDYLEPLLKKEKDKKSLGTIVMATVKGDIHDIGKNLVVLMLKNYGYDVIDLGKDVEPELIIETAKNKNADIIGLSALMTTTMMQMKTVVDLVKKEKLSTKVIIGGAVVTDSFCKEINADGYSDDASAAVKLVNSLLNN